MNEMDEGSSLRSGPSAGGHEERVTLTRAELMSGILVGIGGEHDVVPTQEQLDRTVDMIFRYVRRRDALATQGAARMLAPILWPQADPSPEASSEASANPQITNEINTRGLASNCYRCQHTYNWHALSNRCEACGCGGFVDEPRREETQP